MLSLASRVIPTLSYRISELPSEHTLPVSESRLGGVQCLLPSVRAWEPVVGPWQKGASCGQWALYWLFASLIITYLTAQLKPPSHKIHTEQVKRRLPEPKAKDVGSIGMLNLSKCFLCYRL